MATSEDLQTLSAADELLTEKLAQREKESENIWSYPERDRHDSGHAFFQYPAMMVPAVQRELVEIVIASQPEIRSLIDPYVGAGTTLTAAMHNGLDAYGQDINPLAVLVAKVRSGPFYVEALRKRIDCVIESAKTDSSTSIAAQFPNRQKWFRDDVAVELSKIKRAVERVREVWARRFMWVVLAETIRFTSNDRTTTYKLHARPKHEIETRILSPLTTFTELAENNLNDLARYKSALDEKQYVNRGRYKGKIVVSIGDTTSSLNNLRSRQSQYFDLLVTSPPYGDNRSTITYGQHSYLPLQWIDLQDIDPNVDSSCLDTASSIDSSSIGGKRSRELAKQIEEVRQRSHGLAITLEALKNEPKDRASRVAAFYEDFIRSLDNVLAVLKQNAYLVFTVGNRNVGGVEVPNCQILSELLEARDVQLISQVERQIHNKRMPHRNQIARMMRTEKILIFRNTLRPGGLH